MFKGGIGTWIDLESTCKRSWFSNPGPHLFIFRQPTQYKTAGLKLVSRPIEKPETRIDFDIDTTPITPPTFDQYKKIYGGPNTIAFQKINAHWITGHGSLLVEAILFTTWLCRVMQPLSTPQCRQAAAISKLRFSLVQTGVQIHKWPRNQKLLPSASHRNYSTLWWVIRNAYLHTSASSPLASLTVPVKE